MYSVRQAWANSVDTDETQQTRRLIRVYTVCHSSSYLNKLYLFKFLIKYGKELRCVNTKGKYGKVTDTEIKWSIISKSVMIIIFVQFIDQLIDYPIYCASLNLWTFRQTVPNRLLFCNSSLYVGGFRCSVCFVIICSSAILLLVPFENKLKIKRLPLETKNTLKIENGSSVLLRLFINSNDVWNTAYAL